MSASEFRRAARSVLSGRWGIAIGIAFLASLFGGSLGYNSLSLNFKMDDKEIEEIQHLFPELLPILITTTTISGVIGIIYFFVGGVTRLGYCRCLLDIQRGLDPDVRSLFAYWKHYINATVLNALTALYIALWTILLLIPGIVASYSYAMAPFILAKNPEMGGNAAIKASKELMRGHRWELFCLDLSFIGWNLLALVTFGISSLFVAPYHAQSHAAFYEYLNTPYPHSLDIQDAN